MSRLLCTESRILNNYRKFLEKKEKSNNTVLKYIRDIGAFLAFTGGKKITKTDVLAWKERILQTHAPASVNSMLAALNGYLTWLGQPKLRVRPLKIQKVIYADPEKELGRSEYQRLITAAEASGDKRLSMVLQTICSTGIRVSELKFVTVTTINTGRAVVECKGKTRTVFLPGNLCRSLKKFCKKQRILSGYVFRTKGGGAIDRSNIWKMMKKIGALAGVEAQKIFPHNLRHLFAKTYYSVEKDLSRLADILGHSSVSTTRIYTMECGREHAKQIERLGLILT